MSSGVARVLEKDAGVFFNSPGVAVLRWDPTAGAVFIQWQGPAPSTQFALTLEAGLRALKQYHGSRWLADCRHLKAIEPFDQDWVDRSWFPRMLAAGLRRMAVVMPRNPQTKTNVEDILRRAPSAKLEVAYFATVQDAREWLTRPSTLPPISREAKSVTL